MSEQKHSIAVREATAIETYSDDAFNKVIEAVTRGDMPVETVERLVALAERMQDNRRKQAFTEAMARLQAKVPQITKEGRIVVKGSERSRYARLEDIHTVMQPLLAEEGFSIAVDEDSRTDATATFTMKVSHREGHAEIKRLTVPHDKAAVGQYGPIRSAIQDAGSTASYARRYLYKMHFNLVENDEDRDGMSLDMLTPDQAKDLELLADEVKADKKRFLEYMSADSFEHILLRDLRKAVTALEAKRKKQ